MPVITRSFSTSNLITQNPNIATRTVSPMADHENPPPPMEVTNAELNESLQSVLALVTQNNLTMTTMNTDVQEIKRDILAIKDITNESDGMKEQLYATQGKLSRLEMKNAKLEEKLLILEGNQYAKDLMFYNVDDEAGETEQQLKNSLYDIIEHKMHVPLAQIYSRRNTAGEVRIDTATRTGRYSENKTRPVIATFVTKSGRNIVFSTPYLSNLKHPILARIAEHFPTIIKERRQTQIKHLRRLREAHIETTNRITLQKDKILINGLENNTFAFERNPLPSVSPVSINFEKLAHSKEIVEKKSKFQAHLLPVQSINQAAAAKNAIFQNPELSHAAHIMYAYRIGDNVENFESGFSDDDEVDGGSTLMKLLDTHKRSNVFICVTRIKQGFNIGGIRFTCIENCAKELLIKEDITQDPVFNQIQFN